MRFDVLLDIVGDEPVFEASLLLAGQGDPGSIQRQLSRWVAAGRLHQLRRGLYTLASPFQKTRPHPFLIANRLVRGSYVSLQSALAHHGLIPEYVPWTTSVSVSRPRQWDTPLGAFVFRHLQRKLLTGYTRTVLGSGQHALVATPEKALLDLVYLEPGGDRWEYLEELRLQRLDALDLDSLHRLADSTSRPKLQRAAGRVAELAQAETLAYETL